MKRFLLYILFFLVGACVTLSSADNSSFDEFIISVNKKCPQKIIEGVSLIKTECSSSDLIFHCIMERELFSIYEDNLKLKDEIIGLFENKDVVNEGFQLILSYLADECMGIKFIFYNDSKSKNIEVNISSLHIKKICNSMDTSLNKISKEFNKDCPQYLGDGLTFLTTQSTTTNFVMYYSFNNEVFIPCVEMPEVKEELKRFLVMDMKEWYKDKFMRTFLSVLVNSKVGLKYVFYNENKTESFFIRITPTELNAIYNNI